MLLLLTLLAGLGELHALLNSGGVFLHVTVPRRVRSDESRASDRKVTYIITIDGEPCTLHLRKHSFLPKNLLVYMQNETRVLHSETSYFMMNCHYQGYVAESPNSAVALSVCSGLRGFLQLENVSYWIEPLGSSVRFEHLVYQVKNDNPEVLMSAGNYSNIWQKKHPSTADFSPQKQLASRLLPHYLEMHITVAKDLYDYMGSEMMAVTQKIIQIIGLVNTMFTQFKLTVVLSSLELWSDKNQISTNGDVDDILRRFMTRKQSYLIRPHDLAYLLIYRKHPKYAGTTFPGTVCSKKHDAGVAMYTDAYSLEGFSVIIAQLIGFNLGLTYEDTSRCACPRATCIMRHEAVISNGVRNFSNCSLHEYKSFVSKFDVKCLQKLSDLHPLYQHQPVCGNGILESNEECDCGNEQECQFKDCCDYNTCKLKDFVTCGSGPCCTSKCEFSVAGTPCRKSVDQECDFTEYCNGTSSNCAPDTYALNGQFCRLGTAYCYDGKCQTTDNQCAMTLGKGAKGAPYACFEEVNSVDDKSGNCGFKNSQLPCEHKDILCGKLVCIFPSKDNYKGDVETAVVSSTHEYICVSTAAGSSVTPDGRDAVYVADGTMCGPQMYCVNQTCIKAPLLGSVCNATTKCQGSGICNNFGNCQCFPGYRPPNCEVQIGSLGGSVDDGNVLRSDVFPERHKTNHNNWIVLSFYIVLPFFIIFTIMIIKRSEMKKAGSEEKAEEEGEKERKNPQKRLAHDTAEGIWVINSSIVPESYNLKY
ncbi:disintegrin and metalloproteinase domain-containing protein 18 isoform X1 [Ochotona princeps]|uniref:disintegrin and metalloproteinase domain-containing protein 18 isoform X1 n=2 Tax=Ochotona princeps TaxID=9978 RepID=UPI002714A2D4|nr:disintegrin and metalloproteinase domain-containing protein 18 isoform X1 [Ochotona princeps]